MHSTAANVFAAATVDMTLRLDNAGAGESAVGLAPSAARRT